MQDQIEIQKQKTMLWKYLLCLIKISLHVTLSFLPVYGSKTCGSEKKLFFPVIIILKLENYVSWQYITLYVSGGPGAVPQSNELH